MALLCVTIVTLQEDVTRHAKLFRAICGSAGLASAAGAPRLWKCRTLTFSVSTYTRVYVSSSAPTLAILYLRADLEANEPTLGQPYNGCVYDGRSRDSNTPPRRPWSW